MCALLGHLVQDVTGMKDFGLKFLTKMFLCTQTFKQLFACEGRFIFCSVLEDKIKPIKIFIIYFVSSFLVVS